MTIEKFERIIEIHGGGNIALSMFVGELPRRYFRVPASLLSTPDNSQLSENCSAASVSCVRAIIRL